MFGHAGHHRQTSTSAGTGAGDGGSVDLPRWSEAGPAEAGFDEGVVEGWLSISERSVSVQLHAHRGGWLTIILGAARKGGGVVVHSLPFSLPPPLGSNGVATRWQIRLCW